MSSTDLTQASVIARLEQWKKTQPWLREESETDALMQACLTLLASQEAAAPNPQTEKAARVDHSQYDQPLATASVAGDGSDQ